MGGYINSKYCKLTAIDSDILTAINKNSYKVNVSGAKIYNDEIISGSPYSSHISSSVLLLPNIRTTDLSESRVGHFLNSLQL